MKEIPGIALLLLLAFCSDAFTDETPLPKSGGPELLSINALREYASSTGAQFRLEFEREPLNGIERRVFNFEADGLRQFAMVLIPAGTMPDHGWPVLIFNHGYHPNPPDNGMVNGVSDRPGDYYRGIPLAYALKGFLVVAPDYRGHNVSEGLEYTKTYLGSYWYTRDVIAVFNALGGLPGADLRRVFMMGHSMGGEITLRAALALGHQVRGASVWSSSLGSLAENVMNRQLLGRDKFESRESGKSMLNEFQNQVEQLPFPFEPESGNPLNFIDELEVPLNIHHETRDTEGNLYAGPVSLVTKLSLNQKPYRFYSYTGAGHLLVGSQQSLAISRDVEFFISQGR